LFLGDSHYVDQQYQSRVQDGWQQQYSVTNARTDYTKTSAARKSKSSSRQNCQVSERIASAAEQLLMLATAQTSSFTEPNGLADCRSNSRDSGLGKNSDSGSSCSSVPMASQPSNFPTGTATPARDCQYVKDLHNPQHSACPSSQPPDQPVCTVMPMTNCGRNPSHITARQCEAASICTDLQSAQHEVYQYLNSQEVISRKQTRMTMQPSAQPGLSHYRCSGGKQYCGQRFPVARNVPYYGNTVNTLHYNGHRRLEAPNTQHLSECRGDSNGWRLRHTMPSPSCGRAVDCVPATADITDSAFVADRAPKAACGRALMFDNGGGHRAHGRLVLAERKDELLYQERSNMSLSCQPATHSRHNNIDAVRYHAVQQRYRPYDISADIWHSNSAVPCGSSRNNFYQMSPAHGLMQFRQNDEVLFYDSHRSGNR